MVRHTTMELETTIIRSLSDDAVCAAYVRTLTRDRWSPYTLFLMRSLTFYLQFRDLFEGWRPTFITVLDVLCWQDGPDMANKIAYLLQTTGGKDAFRAVIMYNGLRHHTTDIRRQFPAESSSVALFLRHLPPRVQCRALTEATMGTGVYDPTPNHTRLTLRTPKD